MARHECIPAYYGRLALRPLSRGPPSGRRAAPRLCDDRGVRHLYRCPLRWADLDLLGPRQQRHVRRLPPGGARRHVPDARPAAAAPTTSPRAWWWSATRSPTCRSLTFGFEPVAIECWVTEVRAASFTMAYEIFAEDDGRGPHRLPARPHPADAVRLRDRAPAAAPPRGEGVPLAAPRAATSRVRPPAVPEVVDVPGRPLPGPRAVQRRRRLRPRQQREVLRVLPGGPDPADGRARAASSETATTSSSRRPTSTTSGRSCSAPEPYDCRTWVSRIGSTSVVFESVVLRRRPGARPRHGRRRLPRQRQRPPGTGPGGVPRVRRRLSPGLTRTRACSP